MARARRSESPVFLAPRASQLSRVSFHPRGPDSSQSMSRALTTAVTADFSGNSGRLFGHLGMNASKLLGMTKPNRTETFQSLGEVLRRVAGKLAAQRNKRGGHVGATLDNVTASAPGQGGGSGAPRSRTGGFENSARSGQSHKAGMKGLAGRDPIQRPASARHVRRAMHASGEK
jgi:hypothetical protein